MRVLLLLCVVMAGVWASPARAEICDNSVCFDLFESNGGLFAQLSSSSSAKASPGLVSVEAVDFGPEQYAEFVNGFAGGFDCTGQLAPGDGEAGTPGATTTLGYNCQFQNTNGDTWRISIVITWFWNAQAGRWEVSDIQASSKLIKANYQNQVK